MCTGHPINDLASRKDQSGGYPFLCAKKSHFQTIKCYAQSLRDGDLAGPGCIPRIVGQVDQPAVIGSRQPDLTFAYLGLSISRKPPTDFRV